MKFVVAFAAVLAVASAQFNPFSTQGSYQPGRYRPTPSPLPLLPSPQPPRPTQLPSRVASSDQAASIVRYDSDISPDGSFAYAIETDNGIAAEAQGTPRNLGGNPPVVPVVIQGRYSYISPEGVPVVITYIADENGYQAQGDSIPTPPPIPEPILKSLAYIASKPPAQNQ